MLRYKTTLKLLIPLCIGILLGSILKLHLIVPFSIWCTLFLTLLILHFNGRGIYSFRKLIGINIVLLFLITGVFNYSLHSPELNYSNIENIYLPNDKVIVSINELNYGKGNFYKSISKVHGIIRGNDTITAEGKLLHYINKDFGFLETGDQLIIQSSIQKIKNKGNPGEFDQAFFWFNNGITHQTFSKSNEIIFINNIISFSGFWEKIRNYLTKEMEKQLSPEIVGLATALSLGDKSLLDKEIRENFANAGAMHVLAVSGLHVGILLGIVLWLCKLIPFLQKNYRYLYVSIVVIWFYAMLTGLSPSVARAALMFSILAIGRANGSQFFSLNSLLVSAIILLLWNPLLIYHIGFQLSYSAMLGISFFYKNISTFFYIQNKWIRKLWDGTALGIAAQIGTAPLSLYYFHQFPNYFILTNIIFIVLAGIALGVVLMFFVVHFIPFISDLIGELIDLIYGLIIAIVELINKLPFSVAKGYSISIISLLGFYIVLSLVIKYREKKVISHFIIAMACLLLFSSSFIYQRFENINSNELIILNHKYQVILLKYPGGTFCFYDSNAKGDEESIAFDVDSFHKKYGGNLHFEILPAVNSDKIVLFEGSEYKIASKKNFTSVEKDNVKIILPKHGYKPSDLKPEEKVITGRFSRYYNNENAHNLTKKGAFRMKI